MTMIGQQKNELIAMQYAICNMQYAICDMQYAIYNMQYAICRVYLQKKHVQVGKEMVAVKIFPLQDKQSWFAEQEIYNLPQVLCKWSKLLFWFRLHIYIVNCYCS